MGRSNDAASLGKSAGAELPKDVTFDGRSFAPQLRGERGDPREWIFVQLGARWYARNDGWKLNQGGELFDMKDAPFVERLVAPDAQDAAAKAARQRLQGVLDQLSPATGKTAPPDVKPAAKKAKRAKRKAAIR